MHLPFSQVALRRVGGALALSVAASLLSPAGLGVAAAAPHPIPRSTDEAAAHTNEGARLYRLQNYEGAAHEYERALALGADPEVLWSLAQAYTALGDYEKALLYLRLFATTASPRSPLRPMVRGQIKRVETLLAARGGVPVVRRRIVERTDEAFASGGANAPGKGHTDERPPSEPARPGAPGADAQHPATLTRVVPSADLTPLETAPVSTPVPASASPPPERPVLVARPILDEPVAASPTVTVAPSPRALDSYELGGAGLIAGGAALIGGAIGLAVWSFEVQSQHKDALATNPDLDDKARGISSGATILGVGGAMAAVIGAGIWWRHRPTKNPVPLVSVVPLPAGAAANLGLRF